MNKHTLWLIPVFFAVIFILPIGCRSQAPKDEQVPAAEEKPQEPAQSPEGQPAVEESKPVKIEEILGNVTSTLWLEIPNARESDLTEVETLLSGVSEKPVKLSISSKEKNLYTCTLTVKNVTDLVKVHQNLIALAQRKPNPVSIQYNNSQVLMNYTGAFLSGTLQVQLTLSVQKGSQLWIDLGTGELEETRKVKEVKDRWVYDEPIALQKGMNYLYARTKDKDGASSYLQIDIWTKESHKITEEQYGQRWKDKPVGMK